MIWYLIGVIISLLLCITLEYFLEYRPKKLLNASYKLTVGHLCMLLTAGAFSWLFIGFLVVFLVFAASLVAVQIFIEKISNIIIYEE